jgi:hypothetical protein
MSRPAVAYYRVSTKKQGRSGLGLEAPGNGHRRALDSIQGQPYFAWIASIGGHAPNDPAPRPMALKYRSHSGPTAGRVVARMAARGIGRGEPASRTLEAVAEIGLTGAL